MRIVAKKIQELYDNRNYAKALEKAKELLKYSSENTSETAFANEIIGKIHYDMETYSQAEPYLTEAISQYQKQNNITKEVNTKNILAIALAKSAEYEKSKKYFEEIASFHQSENNSLEVAKALGNIATIYSLNRDFEHAINIYYDCLEIIKESDDKVALAMAYYNLGENYICIQDFENSIKFLNEAIETGKNNGLNDIQARSNDCLAGVSFELNDFETALEYEDKALLLVDSISEKILYNNIQMNKSKILFNMKQFDKSLEIIESVFAEAKEINDQKSLYKYYELKTKIYEQAGNFKDAFYAKVECSKIEQKEFDTERLKILKEGQAEANRLMAELKNEKKEKELIILKNEKELLDKELTYKALQIVQKNEIITSIINLVANIQTKNKKNLKVINEIIELISVDSANQSVWEEFEKWFTEVHKEFFITLEKMVPQLTSRYRQLAAFIKLGLRSKEIALIMGISTESVEKYRLRFRKMLNLKREEKLLNFIDKL